jgi:adenylate kinase
LIILGAPGVGKGTQAIRLQKDFGWVHISTGDMLRDAVQEGTLLGRRAQKYMEKGELVPDDLMIELVANRLDQDDCREGFILDGFPRTVHQAERLDGLLLKLDLVIDCVVSIDVSREEINRRLTQRLVCEMCGYVVTRSMSFLRRTSPTAKR